MMTGTSLTSSWLPGSGRLFGRPADSRQAGQGGAGEDLADVVQRLKPSNCWCGAGFS
jgi:hypothetical protein